MVPFSLLIVSSSLWFMVTKAGAEIRPCACLSMLPKTVMLRFHQGAFKGVPGSF
jgi:hypothetical protein